MSTQLKSSSLKTGSRKAKRDTTNGEQTDKFKTTKINDTPSLF